jgi:hypothetical protein
LEKAVYKIYKRLQNNAFVATFANFIYTKVISAARRESSVQQPENTDVSLPLIAFVCDDMTWLDFNKECRAVFVTPHNWQAVFEQYRPSLFFCESAWAGIQEHFNCWRGRIYRNEKLNYQNRRELFDILEYCKKNQIPTAFWNKEDPTFFENKTYNFVDTALHFDFIFTTAAECVSKYERLGHNNTYMLPFGFSPQLFYPDEAVPKKNAAVFAGSWYADQPDRCKYMVELFEFVLNLRIDLVIYDRHSGSSNPIYQLPEKYRKYSHSAIPFAELGNIYRRSRYVLNINTVTNSETMFARRVYEAMACKCIIISNPSVGMHRQFPGKIWYPGEPFDREHLAIIAEKNCAEVFEHHTCKKRMAQLLQTVCHSSG